MIHKKRPVNLDLSTIKFPPMAIASILHRISGVILFLFLPFILFILNKSLKDPESFASTQALLNIFTYKFLFWSFGAALIYHLLAGMRHLLMDIGYGEHLSTGKNTALAVIILSTILAIILGIKIW